MISRMILPSKNTRASASRYPHYAISSTKATDKPPIYKQSQQSANSFSLTLKKHNPNQCLHHHITIDALQSFTESRKGGFNVRNGDSPAECRQHTAADSPA